MIRIFNEPLQCDWAALTARAESSAQATGELGGRVEAIVERVRTGGDEALRALSREIDGVDIADFRVGQAEIQEACAVVDDELKRAIEVAAANIRKFHGAQRMEPISVETSRGVVCSQRAVAINRVGLYIPGGSAPLFSTVLMLAIPAAVAGCAEVVLCTPPDARGGVAPAILYAASVCGVSEIYKVGGAQAVAAMAYGTPSIARVDKIFGPGNRYVTAAKQLLGGSVVAIDMPAGPSEVMILADGTACAEFVASDMLSQAEHGGDSQAIAVCQSFEFALSVQAEAVRQLAELSREGITRQALKNSKIVVFEDRDTAIRFANAYAAEHLIISMDDPWAVAEQITAAGSVFLGNYTPESAGDYASGTNHTLPTSAWARSMSGVNLDSFVRKITYQQITREGLLGLAPTITTMAAAEGLTAHAAAVTLRIKS